MRNEGGKDARQVADLAWTRLTGWREAVAHLPMRWNLGTQEFRGVLVEFDSKDPAKVTTVRVTAPDNSVEITFLRAVGGPNNFVVPARASAMANPVRLTE